MSIAQYAYIIIAALAVAVAFSEFFTYFSASVSAAPPAGGQAKNLLQQFLAFLKDHAVTLAIASVAATAVYLVLKEFA